MPVFTAVRGLAGVIPRAAFSRAGAPRHYQSGKDFMSFEWNKREMAEIKKRVIHIKNKNNYKLRLRSLKRGATLIVKSAKQKAPRSAGFLANAPGKKRRRGNYTGGRKKATGAWRMIEHRTGKPPAPGASSVGIGVNRGGFYLRFHETGYFAVGRRSRTITKRTIRGHITRKTRRPISVRGVRQYAAGTTWVPPQPFLRPALHEKKQPAASLMMRTYWNGVTKGLPKTRAALGRQADYFV